LCVPTVLRNCSHVMPVNLELPSKSQRISRKGK
jgi:hypothetical protein